ncbi:MAG: hypothetical protein H6Q70_3850 [Firmicutes bacterium]|nr:hypothetical protein [Bacillota bacterium]
MPGFFYQSYLLACGEVGTIIRKINLVFVVFFLLLFSPNMVEAALNDTIENIQVSVQTDGGQIIPDKIAKRMQSSVYTIGDNVLSGHNVDDIALKKDKYESLIHEILDRILIGYSINSVMIQPKVDTSIVVVVSPWTDIINKVNVEVEVNEVSPEIKNLILTDLAEIDNEFNNVLIGLPIDAVDWARSIIKIELTDFLAVQLPEYDASFEVVAGDVTTLKLTLYPKGNVVRDVNLSLHSDSIPNLLLLNFRPYIQTQAEKLIGLPVEFVKRHQNYFINELTEVLNHDKNLKNFGVGTNIKMQVANTTDIMITAETNKYRISLEGYLDMGRKEDNTSFKVHAGKMISPQDEIFVEADFLPHKVQWMLLPGMAHDLTPQTRLGFKYDMNENRTILWAKQQVSEKWLLRFEHTPRLEFNEFAVRYKLHDFVGVEYVTDGEENWLRMVGYF